MGLCKIEKNHTYSLSEFKDAQFAQLKEVFNQSLTSFVSLCSLPIGCLSPGWLPIGGVPRVGQGSCTERVSHGPPRSRIHTRRLLLRRYGQSRTLPRYVKLNSITLTLSVILLYIPAFFVLKTLRCFIHNAIINVLILRSVKSCSCFLRLTRMSCSFLSVFYFKGEELPIMFFLECASAPTRVA